MAERKKVKPFADFAGERGIHPRTVCATCRLPDGIREQLRLAREAGFGSKVLYDYLAEIGVTDVPQSSVGNHLTRGHPW